MIDIEFEDYCVAYHIFEPVFSSTLAGLPSQVTLLAKAVRRLNRRQKRAVTVQEVAKLLKWTESLVYKHKEDAVKLGLIKYEGETHEKNVKRLLPVHHPSRFLPHPRLVLKRNREIGRKVKYVDPFTGEWKKLER
ncbi:MAG TPA: DUF5405 family protein [Dongiaceae bacterium]|nr:DUF5405 family protein [Dongiaceae bacterium]